MSAWWAIIITAEKYTQHIESSKKNNDRFFYRTGSRWFCHTYGRIAREQAIKIYEQGNGGGRFSKTANKNDEMTWNRMNETWSKSWLRCGLE
jgi:hypothetical protein